MGLRKKRRQSQSQALSEPSIKNPTSVFGFTHQQRIWVAQTWGGRILVRLTVALPCAA